MKEVRHWGCAFVGYVFALPPDTGEMVEGELWIGEVEDLVILTALGQL